MKTRPIYQKRENLILPEELRKVCSLPLDIEWTSWEDDQTADNCQTWDGEHQTANISFERKQHFGGNKVRTRGEQNIVKSIAI